MVLEAWFGADKDGAIVAELAACTITAPGGRVEPQAKLLVAVAGSPRRRPWCRWGLLVGALAFTFTGPLILMLAFTLFDVGEVGWHAVWPSCGHPSGCGSQQLL